MTFSMIVFGDLLVAVGGSMSGAALPALLTKAARPGTKGCILGISQSIHSLAGDLGGIPYIVRAGMFR